MTSSQLIAIMLPLQAAHEYAVLANSAHAEDREYYEKKMLNRIQHAAENAGLVNVVKKAAA